jgi:hypothetical protein
VKDGLLEVVEMNEQERVGDASGNTMYCKQDKHHDRTEELFISFLFPGDTTMII